MNVVIISGNLGRDPESRFTTGGTKVANFSIAVNDGYGDNRKTYWFNVVAWEKQAESVEKYLSKGSKVLVEGRLQQREWKDKEGNNRSTVEIVAYRVEFLDPLEARETVNAGTEDSDIPF